MRQVSHADLSACARLLWCNPVQDWPEIIETILTCAEAADRFRKHFGRLHGVWGDGTVAGYIGANFILPPEPCLSAPGYIEAQLAFLHAVLKWRQQQKRMSAHGHPIFFPALI